MEAQDCAGPGLLRVDLVYADAAHPDNIFGTAVYRADARLRLHRELAVIVGEAAGLIRARWGGTLVLKDGLRTVEAQAAMLETPIVRANPAWIAEGPSRLLSPPGCGGHPRGMAVDATVAGPDGAEWDMGTPFDFLTTDPALNPAARAYAALPSEILENRRRLEEAFTDGAARLGRTVVPLPAEWWDFRLPAAVAEQYAPLSDSDLPPAMRMTEEL